ncbi:MAG: hypothetical protein PHI23_01420 [Candidatus Peribacteraceae bacterium]|nr:hypothetical protein [Candidatus Peribacteraceae bacterium]
MRRFLTFVGLEVYAVFLAFLQSLHGVSTDEAKYLLDIPYPHPPLVRWVLGLTDGFAQQEIFWRVVFATLLVQALWLVVAFLPREHRQGRLVLALLWLSSAGMFLQAGAILMAPLTALQALLFSWLLLRVESPERFAGWIALLWLASLFMAYQILLFLPVVFLLFWRMRMSPWTKALLFGAPLLLLVLYTLTNPLIPASMVSAGVQNASGGATVLQSLKGVVVLWAIGGGIVASLLGTWCLLRARQWALLGSLLLLCAYVFLSYRGYYPVLFLPLFLAGIAAAPSVLRRPFLLGAVTLLVALSLSFALPIAASPSLARSTMQQLQGGPYLSRGNVLIAGPFGHEWQYESASPVLRFTSNHVTEARAVICLSPCENFDPAAGGFSRVQGVDVEAWVRLLD